MKIMKAAGICFLAKAGTMHLIVSPFVTQVKAGKFLILKPRTVNHSVLFNFDQTVNSQNGTIPYQKNYWVEAMGGGICLDP